jgi:hypothetical protein
MAKEKNHSPMTNTEWKQCIIGFLDAVERELHPDAPIADREELRTLRSSIERKRVTEARKPYERKVDRLFDDAGRPYLWAAAHRHIGKAAPAAVEQAAALLNRARDLLNRAHNMRIG